MSEDTRESQAWYVKFPQDAYALGPLRFDCTVTECYVREWMRKLMKTTKLPNGFQCWPTHD